MKRDCLTWYADRIQEAPLVQPGVTYSFLLAHLQLTTFDPWFGNDINRAKDGLELRRNLFAGGYNVPSGEATMLEVIYALADRMQYLVEADEVPGIGVTVWFMDLLENLGLTQLTDEVFREDPDEASNVVNVVLSRLNRREYNFDGVGGLFPILNHNNENQRVVELWYQMNAYLIENTEEDE